MSSFRFSRDEVILALDVLYSSKHERISAESDDIKDLSALLNKLPIHPTENRRADFRNAVGITRQINLLQSRLETGNRDRRVGAMFFNIASEFENRHDELHEIAQAIRRNEKYFTIEFGNYSEDMGFPEGVLLGHLHRLIETRDGSQYTLSDRCEVCDLKPELYYNSCGAILQNHLLVPPSQLEGNKKYGVNNYITVCPTCHAVLHRIRPWRTKEDCREVLC